MEDLPLKGTKFSIEEKLRQKVLAPTAADKNVTVHSYLVNSNIRRLI